MNAEPKRSPSSDAVNAQPVGFLAACVIAFALSVAATIYFTRSMGGDMAMPGGWKMSMMWMRMPGQTWFGSAAMFLLMWLAMMIAMMLPSALPTFLKTRRSSPALCGVASGYFGTWLLVGLGVYGLGTAFAEFAMRSERLSRAVPMLSGASLIAAGAFQFTRWKTTGLLRCRSPFGCGLCAPEREPSVRLGWWQGAACCLCCAGPMMVLLALGAMNPFVMIAIALVIAAEKLLPCPEIIARLAGISAIIAGLAILSGVV